MGAPLNSTRAGAPATKAAGRARPRAGAKTAASAGSEQEPAPVIPSAAEPLDAADAATPARAAAASDCAEPAAGDNPPWQPPAVHVPPFWDDACKHLKRRDRVLRRLIPQFGQACMRGRGDAFTTLARSIVGQQISVKAAQSVWERFGRAAVAAEGRSRARRRVAGARAAVLEESVSEFPMLIGPAGVLAMTTAQLRESGLSARKSEYLQDLARHFAEDRVHVGDWDSMEDERVIAELVAIRGIGRWTAEMFLIFHLMRPDVLPLDDLGLLKAISVQYFSGEPVTRAEAREVADAWTPYRSVATWYLWRSLDPVPVDY